MDFGEDFATALLGLDALYSAERGLPLDGSSRIDRLIVLNMSTTHVPESFASYEDAAVRFTELGRIAANLPELDRQLYYRQASDSAIAFVAWRLQDLSFPEQISRFLHVEPRPASESELDALRSEMRAVLIELGYGGDLEHQAQAWEVRQRVESDEVEQVLNEQLDEAWNLTAALMEIPADKSDGMNVENVRDVPYNAMCDFSQRLIRINVDPTLTLPGLRHLAVHEGYPGHYVQFKRREVAYRNGTGTADNLLSVVNTASSSPFEGIADVGLEILGWDQSLDDRLSVLLVRFHTALGTRAAWRLHAEGWSEAEVRVELLIDGLTGGEGWVDSRVRFLKAHDRAALIWSYWEGEPALSAAWKSVKDRPEIHGKYFQYIYDRMHSLRTARMFATSLS